MTTPPGVPEDAQEEMVDIPAAALQLAREMAACGSVEAAIGTLVMNAKIRLDAAERLGAEGHCQAHQDEGMYLGAVTALMIVRLLIDGEAGVVRMDESGVTRA